MIELVLLSLFAMMGAAGSSIFIQYRLARAAGPELPSMKPHRGITSVDLDRQKAIAIGKAELDAPGEALRWEREFHNALLGDGAAMIESGLVQHRQGREYPDYYLEECPCRMCLAVRRAVAQGGPSSAEEIAIYQSVPIWERDAALQIIEMRKRWG